MTSWLAAALLLATTAPAHAGCKPYANGPNDVWRHVDLKKVGAGMWLRVNLVLEADGAFDHQEIKFEVDKGKLPDDKPKRRGDATLQLKSGATVPAAVHSSSVYGRTGWFALRVDEATRDRLLDDRVTAFVVPFEGGDTTVQVSGGAGKKLSKALACVKDHVPD